MELVASKHEGLHAEEDGPMLYVEHAPRDTYCPWRPGGQDLSMCIIGCTHVPSPPRPYIARLVSSILYIMPQNGCTVVPMQPLRAVSRVVGPVRPSEFRPGNLLAVFSCTKYLRSSCMYVSAGRCPCLPTATRCRLRRFHLAARCQGLLALALALESVRERVLCPHGWRWLPART